MLPSSLAEDARARVFEAALLAAPDNEGALF